MTLVSGLLLAGIVLSGCAAQPKVKVHANHLESPPEDASLLAREAEIRKDPVGYLRESLAAARKLDEYTLIFTRYERRGLLIKELKGPEQIKTWFRRDPFSVRFVWLDEDIKYGESTYVQGTHDNKVRFIPRHGLFGLKPGITEVSVDMPVTWGEARYPVTSFGLERLLERTLNSIQEAGDKVTVSYEGLAELPDSDKIVHHIKLVYAPGLHEAPIQDAYFDVKTDLPLMTVLTKTDGALVGSYRYEHVDTDVKLTDADFLLAPERQALADGSASSEDVSEAAAAGTPGDAPPADAQRDVTAGSNGPRGPSAGG